MEFSSFNCNFENSVVPAIDSLFNNDTQLRLFEKEIRKRYGIFEKTKRSIEEKEGMDRFTKSYEEYGVVVTPDGGMKCVEWAPNALSLYLQGEFSNWEKIQYRQQGFGKWELYIPPTENGLSPIRHLSELKLVIETKDHEVVERISPWAKYVIQRSPGSKLNWLFWNPPKAQICQKQTVRLSKPNGLRIYEAHIGIASSRCDISTYQSFTRNVLPRIRDLGYNCVLLMAIMEHPFYPSLGYQVTNFFAASSRYGTPEDLKELIKVAHEMGLYVLMDVTHNQASKNIQDGINKFDGSEGCYLDHRSAGYNEGNDGKSFDYTKWEVLRFLMSNLRYYLEEFSFNGFRFNGVTSMMYRNHGFAADSFNENYQDYFGMQMDFESMVYLMLANDMIHRSYPNAITIAEDYCAIPTLCRPVYEGGIGFDFRATMKLPEIWDKFLTERRDEDWDMEFLFQMLSKSRRGEKSITYAENHEQSLVGRMTLSRHLFGCEDMTDMKPLTPALERGLSLYKMIRLLTHSLAGEGYMTFMGNEFGHPDWVEFPSPTNNNNMEKARRLFHLANDDSLRYKYLNRFDKAMNKAEEQFGWLKTAPGCVTKKHNGDKVFVFERAGLLFMFNFHPTQTYYDYKVGVQQAGRYKIVLDTDKKFFGGHGRNQSGITFCSQKNGLDNKSKSLTVFLPSRTAIVMASEDFIFHGYCDNNNRRGNFYTEQDGSHTQFLSPQGSCSAVRPLVMNSSGEKGYKIRNDSQPHHVTFNDNNQDRFSSYGVCNRRQHCQESANCRDSQCVRGESNCKCDRQRTGFSTSGDYMHQQKEK